MKPETPTRAPTFADWRRAAVAGYERGGLRPEAAAAIVDAAADGVEPMLRGPLTRAALETFCAALDIEALSYARRHGAEIFAKVQ